MTKQQDIAEIKDSAENILYFLNNPTDDSIDDIIGSIEDLQFEAKKLKKDPEGYQDLL